MIPEGHTDLETRLSAYLAELSATPATRPLTAPQHRAGLTRRVHAAWPRAAVLVLAVGVVGAVTLAYHHQATGPQGLTLRPSPPGAGPGGVASLVKDRWTSLPPAPIAGRLDAVTAWDGRAMLVWGGNATDALDRYGHSVGDGAAYDPLRNSWSVLPASPLSARYATANVWTGQYLFIWGGSRLVDAVEGFYYADGALYDPSDRSWRVLPPAPLHATQGAQAVWDGHEVIVLGGRTLVGEAGVAAYDPATDQWRALPSLPTRVNQVEASVAAVATGSSVYAWQAWATVQRQGTASFESSGLSMFRYDPASNAWIAQATTGQGPTYQVGRPLWTGTEVLVPAVEQCPFVASCAATSDLFRGYRWSPRSSAWTRLTRGLLDEQSQQSVWTGAALVDLNTPHPGPDGSPPAGSAAAWDPGTGSWTLLPAAPLGAPGVVAAVWTGDRLLTWGEFDPMSPAAAVTPVTAGFEFGP